MTINEIGLIGEKCFAEYDPGLMSKAVGLREFERWRVGNGIVEIWEGKPQSITQEDVRYTTYKVLDRLNKRPNTFKTSRPPRIEPLPGLEVNAVTIVHGNLVLTCSLQFDAATHQEVLAIACYPSEP